MKRELTATESYATVFDRNVILERENAVIRDANAKLRDELSSLSHNNYLLALMLDRVEAGLDKLISLLSEAHNGDRERMKKSKTTKKDTKNNAAKKPATKPAVPRKYRSPSERAALVKAMGKTPVREYARKIGVALGTLRRWIKEPKMLVPPKPKGKGTKAPR
jgi:hypothetical protein